MTFGSMLVGALGYGLSLFSLIAGFVGAVKAARAPKGSDPESYQAIASVLMFALAFAFAAFTRWLLS